MTWHTYSCYEHWTNKRKRFYVYPVYNKLHCIPNIRQNILQLFPDTCYNNNPNGGSQGEHVVLLCDKGKNSCPCRKEPNNDHVEDSYIFRSMWHCIISILNSREANTVNGNGEAHNCTNRYTIKLIQWTKYLTSYSRLQYPHYDNCKKRINISLLGEMWYLIRRCFNQGRCNTIPLNGNHPRRNLGNRSIWCE